MASGSMQTRYCLMLCWGHLLVMTGCEEPEQDHLELQTRHRRAPVADEAGAPPAQCHLQAWQSIRLKPAVLIRDDQYLPTSTAQLQLKSTDVAGMHL